MELARKCRACLGTHEGMRFISDKPQDKHLIDMYRSLVNFQWLDNDKVAPYLCRQCEFTLEMCYNFQRKCTESNNIIEDHMQQSNEEDDNCDSNQQTNGDEQTSILNGDDIQLETPEKFPKEMIDGLIEARKSPKDSPFYCILCNYFVLSIRALSAHMSVNHRDVRDSWCFSCNKLCDDLQDHQKSTGCLYESCPLCPKSVRKTCMLLHLRSHTEGKLHKVKKEHYDADRYCLKCHRNVDNLPLHEKIHADMNLKNKIFICNLCDKKFKTNSKLQMHIRMHSGDTPYKCDKCRRGFPSPSDLKMHMVTHTGEKPWICNVCGKAYTQHGTLSNHLKQHTGLPEECNICNKRFARKSDLRLHLRNHTGDKSYLCNQCGRTFIQHCHLRDHLLSHSDDRPFECAICSKAFKSKATLAAHVKIHAGNKQFKCQICDYACFKPCRLKEHMKQHEITMDTEAIYECDLCEKTFSTRAVLKAHATLTHDSLI